jgi:hypothetical protein
MGDKHSDVTIKLLQVRCTTQAAARAGSIVHVYCLLLSHCCCIQLMNLVPGEPAIRSCHGSHAAAAEPYTHDFTEILNLAGFPHWRLHQGACSGGDLPPRR